MTVLSVTDLPDDTLELSLEDYRQIFADPQSHILVDVREPWERDIVRLDPSVSMPLGCFDQEESRLPPELWIVTYCHHGVRSLRVCHLLREKGFAKVLSLKGGIHRWAQVIDSKMPTY